MRWILLTLAIFLAGLAGAVTELSSCQTLSSANTVYRLTQAVSSQGSTCFTVTAQNVSLECQGYQLSSNKTAGTDGLYSNQLNTTLDACVVNGFEDGVDFRSGASSSTVQHNTLTNNSAAGFYANGIASLQFRNTTLSENQDGLKLLLVDDVTYNQLTVSSNSRYGIFFNDSAGNQIHNSSVSSSTTYDVFSDSASSNIFVNTTFNKSKAGWNDAGDSDLTVKWLLRVKVENATGGVISGASVNVTNASSTTPEHQLTTDSNGLTGFQIVSEYFQNGSQVYGINETSYTPHNVSGRVADYYFTGSSVHNSTNKTISSTQTFTLVLAGNWALIKGNFSGNKIINSSDDKQFFSKANNSPYGHVFAIPQDGNLNLSALTALTRNTAGGFESDDFSDADALLNLSSQVDSITQVFGGGTTTPTSTSSFITAGYTRSNVPVVNSSNSSNFQTGLLWYSLNVSNYTQAAKPTLILVTKVNRQTQGKYGIYDYEIRIPATLAAYHGGTVVELYGEIF